MIRVKSILGKMFLLNISDKSLFSSAIDLLQPQELVCPHCAAGNSCRSCGSYSKTLISVEHGLRIETEICIPRVVCRSCGHTHAVLPDVLIPSGSYSLRFVITVLWKYLHRSVSVESFCNNWQISISTLYGWIHLFEEHGTLWLGILRRISRLNASAIALIASQEAFPSAFFSRFHFSFLQPHKTSASCRTLNDT